jgi:hypothetical protein
MGIHLSARLDEEETVTRAFIHRYMHGLMDDEDKFRMELVQRVAEITDGIDLDSVAEIVFAIKAGKSVAVIRKDNRINYWIHE